MSIPGLGVSGIWSLIGPLRRLDDDIREIALIETARSDLASRISDDLIVGVKLEDRRGKAFRVASRRNGENAGRLRFIVALSSSVRYCVDACQSSFALGRQAEKCVSCLFFLD
jgi:hypothetical protein